MELSDTMKHAMLRTLQAYKRLVLFPTLERKQWRNFGLFATCRLCKVADTVNLGRPDCYKCPLGDRNGDQGCRDRTWYTLQDTLRYGTAEEVVHAALARLNVLERRFRLATE